MVPYFGTEVIFATAECIQLNSMEFLSFWYITSKQNLLRTSNFVISTSNLEHNLVRYMALIL